MQSLKGNQDIAFKTADKGGGWVIMDKNYYRDKIVKEHLLPNLKGRPVSGGPESPTQRLSNLIKILLKPLVSTLKTCIKDDWAFVRKLHTKIPFDGTMHSCDIFSLYTLIPTERGIEAISY